MRRPTIYTVRYDFPGRVSTMAHPAGGVKLAAELASLRARGTDLIVSALTEDEQTELALLGEGEAAAGVGLEYRGAPIRNLGVPVHADIAPTLAYVHGELQRGAHVVVHCWAGIGRSSLLAASLLVLDGVKADDAWRLISDARGLVVPETDEQRAWVDQLVAPVSRET
jgi:protein-tyrosine phosphatase